MSRSRRKTPIFGHTSARSEADDKRLWHKRWRSHERDQLATAQPEGETVPVHRHAVSSTWAMAKDGKFWFDPRCQQVMAEHIAARRSKLKPERKALQARILAKWRGK
jgi:ABC-type Zn2+ transport system substrate-binding protein/surface adhesin